MSTRKRVVVELEEGEAEPTCEGVYVVSLGVDESAEARVPALNLDLELDSSLAV